MEPIPNLEIVFDNDSLIAINKPHGLLVHRSRIAADATAFAVQTLRDQIGQKVYPVHRLDRKTSGVLLFAKNQKVNIELQSKFRERQIKKVYLAIVRGYLDDSGRIDYALTEAGKTQEATTEYRCLQHFELQVPSGKFKTSRYSLAELYPITGRYHQLRKHLAHIFHPIIGDRPHGCNKQNKLWKEKLGIDTMLLHAQSLSFEYPNSIEIVAEPSFAFKKSLKLLQQEHLS